MPSRPRSGSASCPFRLGRTTHRHLPPPWLLRECDGARSTLARESRTHRLSRRPTRHFCEWLDDQVSRQNPDFPFFYNSAKQRQPVSTDIKHKKVWLGTSILAMAGGFIKRGGGATSNGVNNRREQKNVLIFPLFFLILPGSFPRLGTSNSHDFYRRRRQNNNKKKGGK